MTEPRHLLSLKFHEARDITEALPSGSSLLETRIQCEMADAAFAIMNFCLLNTEGAIFETVRWSLGK